MSKKVLSIFLVAVMLFSFTSVCASAEAIENPEYSITKKVSVTVMDSYVLTDSGLSPFSVEVNLDDKNIAALDGATTEHTLTINEISSKRSGGASVIYNEEDPEPFLDIFRFENEEERESIAINITFTIDFKDAEVFGDLGYEIVINGFSTPPSLGIDLGNAVAVPTAITYENEITEFPKVSGKPQILDAPIDQFYLDSETPKIEGTQLSLETVVYTYDTMGNIASTTPTSSGTVTYSNENAHMFTTIPAKNENLTVDTKQIVTYFAGIKLSSLPVTVSHDMSSGPVNITTDKYSANKPGYHAYVCNGCGYTENAQAHRPEVVRDDAGNPVLDENGAEIQDWKFNNDATFTGNGTASVPCQDCGATLTKDVLGSAQFNTTFANYHFLLVIFEYINLILRIIGAAGN